MSPDDFRFGLNVHNNKNRQKLESEAYQARESLITEARDYALLAFEHDLDTYADPESDNKLYVQIFSRHEEKGNDAYGGENSTIAIHFKDRPITKSLSTNEMFIHFPMTKKVFNSTKGFGIEGLRNTYELFKEMPIESINIQYIINIGKKSEAIIKHITPFGSIDYSAFSSGQLAEHLEEFDFFLEHLPSDDTSLEEVVNGHAPTAHYVKPDIKTDLSYINNLREDIINMELVPQKEIFKSNRFKTA